MENSQTSEILIRRANFGDVDTLLEFNAALAWETEGKTLDWELLRQGLETLLRHEDRGFYTVAEVGGRVVGQLMITYEWSDWRNAHFWWIQSVYVSADYRRRGIYRSLHDHVRIEAEKMGGVCGLRLYVERENHVAQQVYVSMDMYRAPYDLYEIDFVLKSN
ncbi:MAG: GNAT family N-acetyltransferase [Chloroflexi bacterium]|nr:GNAT family N-acetyltransferase [Chloroflexota bacterium]